MSSIFPYISVTFFFLGEFSLFPNEGTHVKHEVEQFSVQSSTLVKIIVAIWMRKMGRKQVKDCAVIPTVQLSRKRLSNVYISTLGIRTVEPIRGRVGQVIC